MLTRAHRCEPQRRGPRCLGTGKGAARAAWLLGLLGLGAPRVTWAVPLAESERHTIHVDGALKAFVFALHFPHYQSDVLPLVGLGNGRWGGLGVADARIELEGTHQQRVSWQVHYRTQPYVASSFAGAQSALGFVSAGQPARVLPLQVVGPDQTTFQWRQQLDRLSVQLHLGPVDVTIGRQAVSFGVGFVWLPADLVGTFSPLELDQEFKPGVDALRVNVALGAFTELAFVAALGTPRCTVRSVAGAATQPTYSFPDGEACSQAEVRWSGASEHSVAMTRLRTTLRGWDVGLLTGWVRGDVVAGAFSAGAIGNLRVRAEAVYTWDLEWDATYAGSGNPASESDHFVRAVLGADYRFDTARELVLLAELYYNGFGTFEPRGYLSLAGRPRVAEFGEVFNLGQLYAAVGVTWEPHERLQGSLLAMANLHDPSAMCSATLSYTVSDESVVVAGAQLPLGQGRSSTPRSRSRSWPAPSSGCTPCCTTCSGRSTSDGRAGL